VAYCGDLSSLLNTTINK
jgi:hypothetical protein